MSKFQEFNLAVQKDPALQKEMRAKLGDLEAGVPADKLAEFAAAKGYKFTVEEMKGELSDEQLGAVSGGAYEFYQKLNPGALKFDPAGKVQYNFAPLLGKF